MPIISGREVDTYKVSVFESSNLNYDRSMRLVLKPGGGDPSHIVDVEFPPSAPADFVDIGSSISTVRIDRAKFEDMVRMLQTESPVFFSAFEFGGLRFAGLSTDPEFTGEGLMDSDSAA
jgi:hypothetical protein